MKNIARIRKVLRYDMNYRKMVITKESKIWIAIGCVCLLVFNVIGLNQMLVPTILHDEIGYWANAAYFAGYDWSDITSVFSYYSYGIGLIFALFMRLTKDMVLVYKMIIGLNIILMFMMFMMSYKICGILFKDAPRNVKVLASVISLCYPTYMMNIGIAWSEYYILFMIWVNLFLLIHLLQKQNVLWIILYGISLCYIYMIHQRMVGVVVVGICTITYLLLEKKVSIKNYIFFIFTVGLVMIIHMYIKNDIMQNLWNIGETDEVSNANNGYSGRLRIMIYCFKNAGIESLFRSIIGKLYYLMTASGGIYVGSIIAGIHAIKRLLKQRTDFMSDLPVLYMHLITASLFIISSIVSMEDGVSVVRIDSLIYGRYIECVIGPLLMIGVMEFYQNKYVYRFFPMIAMFLLSISLLVVYIYKTGKYGTSFLASCAGGVSKYYDLAGDYDFIFLGAIVTICVLSGMFLFMKYKRGMFTICAFFLVLMLYVSNGEYLNKKTRNSIQNDNHTMIEFVEHIKKVQEKVPVYCIRGNLRYAYMSLELVQFLLPDYKMVYLTKEDSERLLEENFYLLVETVDTVNMDEYVQIDTVPNGWLVMVKRNSNLYTKVIERWE